MLILREFQEDDIAVCARIMAENPLWQRYQLTEQSALNRLADGFFTKASILVAEDEGKVAGFIWYVLRGAFQRSGYIMIIAVAPGIQGKGVGAALMNGAESHMRGQVQDVFLLVSDFNVGAQSFYRKQGYEQVGTIPDYVVSGIGEFIFRKKI